MRSKKILPVDYHIHRKCSYHEHINLTESVNKHNNRKQGAFTGKLLSSGVFRFAGWWSIFAGALAVNSVCPVCGSQGCPVGVGTTGIIAVFFAGIKQWGGKYFTMFQNYIRHTARNTFKKQERESI